jgi:CheY-like chemotaxis protein
MTTLAPPKKILTVEDNAIVSADVRSILEGAGYDVCPEAYDGVQAVEHVRAYAPDLILLDLRLPLLDGVETASRIREESDAPILVLTGSNDPELLGRAQAAGTTGHVLKPFSESGLLSAVKSRLAEHESNDFHLRCIVDSMVRDGADEKSIVRALERLHTSHTTRTQARPSLRQQLRRLARFVPRRQPAAE